MKKIFLFFLLPLLNLISLPAQTYHPFSSIDYWGVMAIGSSGTHRFEVTYEGDSLYNSLIYRKYRSDSTNLFLLREDTAAQRVYTIHPGEISERTLYDFSLNIGDTIHLSFSAYPSQTMEVFNVDTVITLAGPRRRLYLYTTPGMSLTITWIEQVGVTGRPFYTNWFGISDPAYLNVCVWSQNVQIYDSGFDTCQYQPATSLSQSLPEEPIWVTCQGQEWTISSADSFEEGMVLYITGKVVGQLSQVHPGKFRWNSEGVSAGVYLLRLNGEEKQLTQRILVGM